MRPGALERDQAAAYVAVSVSSFERYVRQGTMPKPRKLGQRRVVWLTQELDAALGPFRAAWKRSNV